MRINEYRDIAAYMAHYYTELNGRVPGQEESAEHVARCEFCQQNVRGIELPESKFRNHHQRLILLFAALLNSLSRRNVCVSQGTDKIASIRTT